MAELQIRDLTDTFGSEIAGLDVNAALADPQLGALLRELFDTRGVLVFPDVVLDQVEQANLVRMLIGLGPLADGESPTGRATSDPFYVSNKEAGGGAPYGRLLFHSDMMWSEHTFQVLSLYGVAFEPPVSPTIFTSVQHGWATLSEDLRSRVEGLAAIQGHDVEERARAENDPDVLVSTFEHVETRRTPVHYRHPRTGAELLYVSQQMTRGIEGWANAESEALLEELFAHLYQPDAIYEHHWRVGDLVAWDNIAIQHARPNVDLEGPVRTLRKVYAPIPPREAILSRPTFANASARR